MVTRRVEAIMYGKFNNNSKGGSLLYANKDGVVVVNKPFKEVLQDVVEANNTAPCIEKGVTVADSTEEEVELLWQHAIHKNYVNEYKKKTGGR